MPSREVLLAETFVQLADTLVDDFDIVELLTVLADRCVELLDAAAAGILLVDQRGALQVVAASTEQARLLELFQLQNHEGPCLDCFSSGRAVVNQTLADANPWPRFAPEALAAGFQSVQALPLRLRDTVIGALNVFMAGHVAASDADLAVAQALADVATIALLQNQTARHSQVVNSQLQRRVEQPYRHRAGQGCARRAGPASTWMRPSHGCGATPAATTASWRRWPASSSTGSCPPTPSPLSPHPADLPHRNSGPTSRRVRADPLRITSPAPRNAERDLRLYDNPSVGVTFRRRGWWWLAEWRTLGRGHGLRFSDEGPVVTGNPRCWTMDPQSPTYFVCSACLALLHQDCANRYESGTCGCACRYADVDQRHVGRTSRRSGDDGEPP